MQRTAIGSEPFYKIELQFACRELVDLDVISKTDPFLIVSVFERDVWKTLGQTEVIYNDLNPQFKTSFKLDFYFEKVQPFKVQAYHHNSETDKQYIGEVTFNLSELMGCKDDILEKPIRDLQTNKPNRGFVSFDLTIAFGSV